jgi:hypothetical protein
MTNIVGNDVAPTGEVTLTQLPPGTDINRSKDRQAVRSQLPHLPYRRDIDGLRAVAVAAVVLFHAFPRWLAGGYVGVDVFFVISGFLISSILFKSLATGSFTFSDFYARRARRIFPALGSMLVPVGLLGWYVLTPDEFSTLGKHIASGGGLCQQYHTVARDRLLRYLRRHEAIAASLVTRRRGAVLHRLADFAVGRMA